MELDTVFLNITFKVILSIATKVSDIRNNIANATDLINKYIIVNIKNSFYTQVKFV